MGNWAKIIIGDSRKMLEVADNSVHLVVTSPPYWSIKDYGTSGQIGYGQSLHEYLRDIYRVWKESFRVLKPGRRLCINIGDQFTRSAVYGKYKVIPIHSEIIAQCEEIGFDYMGSIIWQKKTTMNTSGGANVMGSYPYPPNGIVEIDYEFILIFKKPGKIEKVSSEVKERSKLTKEEWKEYFYGHWYFGGARQIQHEAMFPEELPKRLIKMFTFLDEVVLDPFIGSGTTAKVALNLGRNVIGYEINEKFIEIIENKLGLKDGGMLFKSGGNIEITKRQEDVKVDQVSYTPRIKDLKPLSEPDEFFKNREPLYRVVDILDEGTLKLDSGSIVKFKGLKIIDKERALEYLKNYILKKSVYLKFDNDEGFDDGISEIEAYVYLKNRIFVNAYMIKAGMAMADREKDYKYKSKFISLEKEWKDAQGMDSEYGHKQVGTK